MQERFTLEEIIRTVQGKLMSGGKAHLSIPPEKICTDTRKLKEGELFIALVGEHFDGHSFVKEAWKKGACGAIVAKPVTPPSPSFPIIKVENTLYALQELAKFHRRRLPSSIIVGITGSNGKTTVKEMSFEILSRKYYVLKSEGNFNNQIGVPLSLLKLCPHHQIAVLEMGMNLSGEIARLAEIIQPDVGLITNIHRSHIGPLGSIEAIKEAKAEFIPYLNERENSCLVLNGDDHRVRDLRKRASCRVITFGVRSDCDVKAEDVQDHGERMSFTLSYEKEKISVELPIPGRHNIYNALASSAVAIILKVPLELIAQALSGFRLPPSRCQIIKLGKYKLINDSYNANPESMKEALNLLSKLGGRRKIAILGDMLELGKQARAAHREVGEKAGKIGIDALYVLGEFSREVEEGAKEMGMKEVFSFNDKDELVDELISYLKEGDCLLVKGSRKMKMEEIVEKLKESLCSVG